MLDSLRMLFSSEASGGAEAAESLWDFLSGYVGTVSGATEALSEDCGQRFTDDLVEKQKQGHL